MLKSISFYNHIIYLYFIIIRPKLKSKIFPEFFSPIFLSHKKHVFHFEFDIEIFPRIFFGFWGRRKKYAAGFYVRWCPRVVVHYTSRYLLKCGIICYCSLMEVFEVKIFLGCKMSKRPFLRFWSSQTFRTHSIIIRRWAIRRGGGGYK